MRLLKKTDDVLEHRSSVDLLTDRHIMISAFQGIVPRVLAILTFFSK